MKSLAADDEKGTMTVVGEVDVVQVVGELRKAKFAAEVVSVEPEKKPEAPKKPDDPPKKPDPPPPCPPPPPPCCPAATPAAPPASAPPPPAAASSSTRWRPMATAASSPDFFFSFSD